eukprot:7888510-Lingulodinium_polyedra.AAC.1
MQATFAAAVKQPIKAPCIERPSIRARALCCIRWHKEPSYMGKNGKISSVFKRSAQKSKNWRPRRDVEHALAAIEEKAVRKGVRFSPKAARDYFK